MNITSFIIYCVIVTFTPGPTNIIILSTVNNLGIKSALKFTYGATIAFGLLLSISAILNSALITVLPMVLPILRIIGSLYIAFLAYQILRADSSKQVKQKSKSSYFIHGFSLQFINPKVVLFTMTVIPSFILPHYNSSSTLLLFVFCITAIGFLAFVTWILFGKIFKDVLQKYQKTANILMAMFLIYSAVMVSGLLEMTKR